MSYHAYMVYIYYSIIVCSPSVLCLIVSVTVYLTRGRLDGPTAIAIGPMTHWSWLKNPLVRRTIDIGPKTH